MLTLFAPFGFANGRFTTVTRSFFAFMRFVELIMTIRSHGASTLAVPQNGNRSVSSSLFEYVRGNLYRTRVCAEYDRRSVPRRAARDEYLFIKYCWKPIVFERKIDWKLLEFYIEVFDDVSHEKKKSKINWGWGKVHLEKSIVSWYWDIKQSFKLFFWLEFCFYSVVMLILTYWLFSYKRYNGTMN